MGRSAGPRVNDRIIDGRLQSGSELTFLNIKGAGRFDQCPQWTIRIVPTYSAACGRAAGEALRRSPASILWPSSTVSSEMAPATTETQKPFCAP